MIRSPNSELSTTFFCIRCFNLTAVPPTSGKQLTCLHCGRVQSKNTYDSLVTRATEHYQAGFVYRRVYESQEKQFGEVKSLYYLDPPEGWLIWSSMTILSAIVGGAAWDGVKAAVRRLHQSFRRPDDSKSPDLTDPKEFEVVVEYIREYQHGMPSASEGVRAAIVHELLADASKDHPGGLLDSSLNFEELAEQLRPHFEQVLRELKQRPPLTPSNFKDAGTRASIE